MDAGQSDSRLELAAAERDARAGGLDERQRIPELRVR
jgi:hypothetical protein